MDSPAAPSSSSCGRLSPTPRSTASPTRSRAPTCAPTKYDLGGDDPEKFQPQDGRPEGPPTPVSPRIGSRWRVECKASTMRMWLRAARYKRPEVRESRSLWQMLESRAVRRAAPWVVEASLGLNTRWSPRVPHAGCPLLYLPAPSERRHLCSLWGARNLPVPATWGDSRVMAVGHHDQPCPSVCSI
jgi:hypothetical protein